MGFACQKEKKKKNDKPVTTPKSGLHMQKSLFASGGIWKMLSITGK